VVEILICQLKIGISAKQSLDLGIKIVIPEVLKTERRVKPCQL